MISVAADRTPEALALTSGSQSLSYAQLQGQVQAAASGLIGLGLQRGERVGIYLDKRVETVVASFAAPASGGVFVPINPLLKPAQLGYVMQDCDVRVLVTSPERCAMLADVLAGCPALRCVVLTATAPGSDEPRAAPVPMAGHAVLAWADLLSAAPRRGHRVIDSDVVAILYTSGSTGKPKGVVLSHRNMVTGAKSVASYLDNHAGDTLLAALPLSFDAGFSQLTTAFHAGARVVLLNYLMPRDVL